MRVINDNDPRLWREINDALQSVGDEVFTTVWAHGYNEDGVSPLMVAFIGLQV